MILFGLLWIAIAWLLADLMSGMLHWWEDRYADSKWPVLGKWIALPNQLHHTQPLAFLRQGYWSRNWTTIIPALILFGATVPHPICLVFLFVSQANEIHALAHRKGKVPRWVAAAQRFGILQSPKHHAGHHRYPYCRNYCAMTDWLNPMLERLDVWRKLESAVQWSTGIQVRAEEPKESCPSKRKREGLTRGSE